MNIYADLYRFAGELEEAWKENEGVEWQEAEDLVHQIEKIAEDDRDDLQMILNYAEAEDEWDCDEVATWPMRVMSSLEDSDKEYRYRPDGESWEVYGVYMSGTEDWVATVDTESVANLLITALLNPVALTKANYLNQLNKDGEKREAHEVAECGPEDWVEAVNTEGVAEIRVTSPSSS